MRRFIAFPIALAAALITAAPAIAGSIAVPMDQVRMVTFEKPVSTVYVGNPSIADVTVIDSRRIFVLGKSFGTTNVVALDANGQQVADDPLTVYGRSAHIVTLNRGADQVTYSCADARCETAPLPGDTSGVFKAVSGETAEHQDAGKNAALASNAQ